MADGGVLTDRASMARAFYRLCAVNATNPAMIEHDGAATLEAVYQFLQYGLWDAQEFLLDCGLTGRWVTTSSALSFAGADSTDGGRYAPLPADFMRLAGDQYDSALRTPDGKRWGQLIDFKDRRAYGPNRYWLQSTTSNVWRVWITPGSSVPTGLVADYHHRLGTLADAATVEFPPSHLALPVAYAADRAMTDAWLPGDVEMQAKIASNLIKQQKEARRRMRLHHGPKKIRTHRTGGTHYWA